MGDEKIYRRRAPEPFSLALTLESGQAFRWERDENGVYTGVVFKRVVRLKQEGGELLLLGGSREDFEPLLARYFDLERDYRRMTEPYLSDRFLRCAVGEFAGIRILRQEPWETLCTFILSQNNNISRIKGIVKRLCEGFGEPLGGGFYAFPEADALAGKKPEELSSLRAGYRAGYVLDAARKVAGGVVDLEAVREGGLEAGRAELQKIRGVGKKVADCTLLFGFGKLRAFPRDVWIERTLRELYPNGLPSCAEGSEGVAQQYLFHWRRNSPSFAGKMSK